MGKLDVSALENWLWEAACVIRGPLDAPKPYNLSPSRYVASNDREEVPSLEEAMVLLREAEEERVAANRKLKEILQTLGLEE